MLSITYACPYHNPIPTMGHPIHNVDISKPPTQRHTFFCVYRKYFGSLSSAHEKWAQKQKNCVYILVQCMIMKVRVHENITMRDHKLLKTVTISSKKYNPNVFIKHIKKQQQAVLNSQKYIEQYNKTRP